MIQLENICKQYTNHNHTVRAVDNVSFSVAENERVGIAGGSGSGKSTLLRMIAMLEKPTSGILRLFGEEIHSIQNHPLSAGCHRLLSIVTKMLTYGSNKYSCTSSEAGERDSQL